LFRKKEFAPRRTSIEQPGKRPNSSRRGDATYLGKEGRGHEYPSFLLGERTRKKSPLAQ